MKYILVVQTTNGQKQVQVEAPKVDLISLLFEGIESLKKPNKIKT